MMVQMNKISSAIKMRELNLDKKIKGIQYFTQTINPRVLEIWKFYGINSS